MVEVPNSGGGSEGPGDTGASDLYGASGPRAPQAKRSNPVPCRRPPPPGRKPRPLIATLSSVLSFVGIAAVAVVILVSLGIQRCRRAGTLAGRQGGWSSRRAPTSAKSSTSSSPKA